MDDKENIIMDKLTKICTCKSISKYKIKQAIEKGYDNIETIRKKTGAGSGYCNGKNCTEPIQNLIDDFWENK
ncbi:(2Fe-2S)-binding protein [Miniphocaeibacter halophilus]|uniref:(2Fe-2S)-binding protein n=1 Tax=Miniphocaeibacter halophilus TaxID=2931922 RepID=A0AC61MT41_9FIRM|nr:(2Fe-2S)-binding protein [Miniphocaeibacter halophilus]QQK07391.1 (2Fe-2S)-binding protein [Miniphocaeibacter halophilus]